MQPIPRLIPLQQQQQQLVNTIMITHNNNSNNKINNNIDLRPPTDVAIKFREGAMIP